MSKQIYYAPSLLDLIFFAKYLCVWVTVTPVITVGAYFECGCAFNLPVLDVANLSGNIVQRRR